MARIKLSEEDLGDESFSFTKRAAPAGPAAAAAKAKARPAKPVPPPTPGGMAMEDMSIPQRFLAGMGSRMSDVLLGGQQLAANVGALFSERQKAEAERLAKEYAEKRKMDLPLREDPYGGAGAIGADVAAFGLPLSRVAMAPLMATGAAYGAMEPLEETGLFPRAMQAGRGAALAGAPYAAISAGTRATQALRGPRGLTPEGAAQMEVADWARKHGLDLTLGDILGPRSRMQTVENVFRPKTFEEQAKQLEYLMDIPGYNYRNRMIENIKATAGDVGKENIRQWQNVYSAARELPKKATSRVNPDEMRSAVKEFADKFGTEAITGLENKRAARLLSEMLTGAKPRKLSFEEARELQRALGTLHRQSLRMEATGVRSPEYTQALKGLRTSITKDIDTWGEVPQNKPVYGLYNEARRFTREKVVPFTAMDETRFLPKVVQGKFDVHPFKMYEEILRPSMGHELGTSMQLLDPDTQMALRAMRAAERGTKQLIRPTPPGTLSNIAATTLPIAKQAVGRGLTWMGERPFVQRMALADISPLKRGPLAYGTRGLVGGVSGAGGRWTPEHVMTPEEEQQELDQALENYMLGE